MPLTLNGTTGISFVDSTIQSSAVATNRIINGAMVFDQRNAGASITPTNTQYTLDRYWAWLTQASKFTVQQNAGAVTPPAGFSYYLGVTSSSAYSVVAADYFAIVQTIEGYNIADLAWGTASAATVTLSFWVRSSLTGTFGGSLENSAQNRSYPFTYTISSANTWTQISVTIAGDTSGTWLTTNGKGIQINWGLGVGTTNSGTAGAWAAVGLISATGAVSVVGTSGATFYITGVQLEKATSASSFGFRQYTDELCLCQRYYCKSYDLSVVAGTASTNGYISQVCNNSSTQLFAYSAFPVRMRTNPTITLYSYAGTAATWANGGGVNQAGTGSLNATETAIQGGGNTSALTLSNSYIGQYTASSEL
jgi:hypothetical protein